jgi:hypothetical protein
MKNAGIGISVVTILLFGMTTVGWAGAGGGGGGRVPSAGGGGGSAGTAGRPVQPGGQVVHYQGQGGGSATIQFPPAKVTLLRMVDLEGNVDYESYKDAESANKKLKELTAQYEKALAWRQTVEATLAKQGLKSDHAAPVEPIVDVVKKDIAKADVAAAIKEAKDWAIYEIAIGDRVKRVVAYAHTDAFAKALADAEFGRVYNQWVQDGRKDGQEPNPPTVTKAGDALDKAQAKKALLAKAASGNAAPGGKSL